MFYVGIICNILHVGINFLMVNALVLGFRFDISQYLCPFCINGHLQKFFLSFLSRRRKTTNNEVIAFITFEPAVQRFPCVWKWGVWVMINSESSELKQIIRGNIPPNAYFFPKKSMFKCSLVPALAIWQRRCLEWCLCHNKFSHLTSLLRLEPP